MPAGPIENQDGMGAGSDLACNLIEVKLHGRGVAVGQDQAASDEKATDKLKPRQKMATTMKKVTTRNSITARLCELKKVAGVGFYLSLIT